jgi:DNA-binding transcriptional MerR regulator
MRYRVDALAAKAGVSVDTIRFYQGKGLLPQPEREGRAAWYSGEHLDRLARIRDLKDKGFTLESIRAVLSGEIDEADRALVEAVISSDPGPVGGDELLTLDEVAERTGVTPALLEAIEREGLLTPRRVDGATRYSSGDVEVVKAGLKLLETGLPLSELLALAREHDQAMRVIARRAVEMFLSFVRDPIRARAADDEAAATELVDAFRKMLPATTSLVTNHFQRALLSEAQARIEAEGNASEIEAVKAEAQWAN